jgi:hypothetical protein
MITCEIRTESRLKFKLKLIYDRQSVGVGLPSRANYQIFVFRLIVVGFSMGALFDARMCLKLTCTIASGPCQSSHSRVKSRRTHDHILLYLQGNPIVPPGHWVPLSSPIMTLRARVEVL